MTITEVEAKFKNKLWITLFEKKGNGFKSVWLDFDNNAIGLKLINGDFYDRNTVMFTIPYVFSVKIIYRLPDKVIEAAECKLASDIDEETLDNLIMSVFLHLL